MNRVEDPKRNAILVAAFTQFSGYGFRRTSMEDIATTAGVSRASLYSYFGNKEEIFRCLSASIHEQALADAEAALRATSGKPDIARRVEGALVARFARLQEVVTQSPHGREIYDEDNRLCGDLVLESSARFRALLAAEMRAADRAGAVDLKGAGLSAPAAAELIQLGASGLKQGASDVATLKKRLRRFVRVFFAGLR
jgi:AcrR family transcriptional regulator